MNTAYEPDTTGEVNLVQYWLRKDTTRWKAGILAGLFAGVIMLAFAMVLAKALGVADLWFPVKLWASVVLGTGAMEYGNHMSAIVTGFVFFEVLAAILGFAYAHFVFSNSFSALLPMGLVWGVFLWIFWWNLYMQSIPSILWMKVSPAAVFPVVLVFGISLTSVAFFDRAMRGDR